MSKESPKVNLEIVAEMMRKGDDGHLIRVVIVAPTTITPREIDEIVEQTLRNYNMTPKCLR